MKALLHYNFLKGWRDRSVIAFTLIPALMPVAALCGATFSNAWSPHPVAVAHYPMFMEMHYSPAQNAKQATDLVSVMCAFFALIPAFWAFRTEMMTRSVASLAMAARSLQIVLASILYAAGIVCAAWIIGIAFTAVLTTAVSPTLVMSAIQMILLTLASASLGTLGVIISPQPAMLAGAFPTVAVAMSFIEKKKLAAPQMIAYVVFAIVAAAIASFLLERRCAR